MNAKLVPGLVLEISLTSMTSYVPLPNISTGCHKDKGTTIAQEFLAIVC